MGAKLYSFFCVVVLFSGIATFGMDDDGDFKRIGARYYQQSQIEYLLGLGLTEQDIQEMTVNNINNPEQDPRVLTFLGRLQESPSGYEFSIFYFNGERGGPLARELPFEQQEGLTRFRPPSQADIILVATALLKLKYDPNGSIRSLAAIRSGSTGDALPRLIHLAVDWGYERVVRFLLRTAEVDLNTIDRATGETALQRARRLGESRRAIINLLSGSDRVHQNVPELRRIGNRFYSEEEIRHFTGLGLREEVISTITISDVLRPENDPRVRAFIARCNEDASTRPYGFAIFYFHEEHGGPLATELPVEQQEEHKKFRPPSQGDAILVANALIRLGYDPNLPLRTLENIRNNSPRHDLHGRLLAGDQLRGIAWPRIIHCGVDWGYEYLTRFLLSRREVDPNMRDGRVENTGDTALHRAVRFPESRRPILNLLLSSERVNPNLQDNDRQTALHIALDNGDVASSEHLLRSLLGESRLIPQLLSVLATNSKNPKKILQQLGLHPAIHLSHLESGSGPVILSSSLPHLNRQFPEQESIPLSKPAQPADPKGSPARPAEHDPEVGKGPQRSPDKSTRLPIVVEKPGVKIPRLIVYLVGLLTGGVVTNHYWSEKEDLKEQVLGKKKSSV